MTKEQVKKKVNNIINRITEEKEKDNNYRHWIINQFIDPPLCFPSFESTDSFDEHLKNFNVTKKDYHKSHLRFYLAEKVYRNYNKCY